MPNRYLAVCRTFFTCAWFFEFSGDDSKKLGTVLAKYLKDFIKVHLKDFI